MNTDKLITAIDNKWEKLQIINKDFTIDYIMSLSPKINHFDLIDGFNKLIDLNNQLNFFQLYFLLTIALTLDNV